MILELREANRLPMKTFRWPGVNELKLKEEIPDIKPFKTVELTGEGAKDAVITPGTNLVWEQMPPAGMGEEAAAFLHRHKNREMTLTVPKGRKIPEPLFLHYMLDQADPALAEELYIRAEEDSEVTLVITYEGEAGVPLFHGGLIYLLADKNAAINLIQIQLIPEDGIHFNNIGAECGEGAKVRITQCELGASHAVNGIMAGLRGNESELTVDTIYLGDRERSLDFNYVANHYGKKSKSDMRVHGALLDNSRKIFRGTIDFKKGASGSEGAEGEYTLLFNKNIKNVSVPLILCGEEDVSGKHAANSGKIDEDKLFYLMSRGLSEGEAKKMMLEAWFHPVIDNIPSETLREQVSLYVKERLKHVESL
jgi:Fe-S cluster assembly scaffold protein SufB